jgi:anti-sigma regulatory factor (Ser/Thr protein kinase)
MSGGPEGFPDSPAVLDEGFEPTVAATAQVRRMVRALLTQRRVTDAAAEDTLLVVHELVANVVDHARTPFRLVVRVTGSAVKIRVRDRSTRAPQLRPGDTRAFRGRGLQLIAALSRRWGFEEEDDGKTVWADISV